MRSLQFLFFQCIKTCPFLNLIYFNEIKCNCYSTEMLTITVSLSISLYLHNKHKNVIVGAWCFIIIQVCLINDSWRMLALWRTNPGVVFADTVWMCGPLHVHLLPIISVCLALTWRLGAKCAVSQSWTEGLQRHCRWLYIAWHTMPPRGWNQYCRV